MLHTENNIQLTRALAYIDTEWTDLNPDTRRIISIAITRFNTDGSQQSAYWLVNPKSSISEQSSKIHGINKRHVAGQPEFRAIANDVEKMLEDADIAGYSVTNDIEILEKEMAIARKKWTASGRHIIDAYRLWQVREPRTLSDAYRRFVGPIPEETQAHDARDDVAMTIAIVNAMQQGKTSAELHEEAHPNLVDPAGKFRKEDCVTVYNFGPYRGLPVSDYPEYLEWMLTRSFAPSTVETALNLLNNIRENETYHEDDEEFDEDGFPQ